MKQSLNSYSGFLLLKQKSEKHSLAYSGECFIHPLSMENENSLIAMLYGIVGD